MNRLVAVLAAVALAAGGCSVARSGTLGPAPTGAPPPGAVATPASPPVTGTVTIQLWLVRDGKLVPTRRTRPTTVATSRLALTELTTGPSPAEAAAGLTTGLPAGTTFDITGITGGTETVSFAPAFYTGDADTARLRRAQVVYSLTQFPAVSRVVFRSAGGPVGAPAGRGDYADLLPPIVVTDPAIGQEVASPLTVTGTADVFEATVSVRVLDGAGREIATGFTTATCGTGCRGDYRATVAYRLAEAQAGTVEVYELSPRDGARVHVVAVPVGLAASRG